jgi:NB-ARC domain
VVLHGLGGIGKTQLAIKYAQDHSKDYLAVLWLNGNDVDSLEQSLADAAQRLRDEHPKSSALKAMVELPNPSEIARAMVRWLGRSSNQRWLLVFDNVDNPILPSHPDGAYEIGRYLPVARHGHVIVTTRLSELDIGTSVPVKQLTDVGESVAIIAATSQRAGVLDGAILLKIQGLSPTMYRS